MPSSKISIVLCDVSSSRKDIIVFSISVPNDVVTARKDLDDPDLIEILERCYNVIQGRRTSVTSNSSMVTTTSISNTSNACPLLSKHLKRSVYDKIHLRLTKLDHNLYDLIWPSVKKLPTDLGFRVALEQDFPLGIVVPDFYAYKTFEELLEPIIRDYNNKSLYSELPSHPVSDFGSNGDKKGVFNSDLDLDPGARWIISGINQYKGNFRVNDQLMMEHEIYFYL